MNQDREKWLAIKTTGKFVGYALYERDEKKAKLLKFGKEGALEELLEELKPDTLVVISKTKGLKDLCNECSVHLNSCSMQEYRKALGLTNNNLLVKECASRISQSCIVNFLKFYT